MKQKTDVCEHEYLKVPWPLPKISNTIGWQAVGSKLRQKYIDYLGIFPRQKCELKMQILHTEQLQGVMRHKIRYQVEKYHWVDAYLMHPSIKRGKLPAMVVFHSTTTSTIEEPAGVDKMDEDGYATALHLARRGYATLSPECFIYRYQELDVCKAKNVLKRRNEIVLRMQKNHPGWVGMTQMVWDGIRAVDCLSILQFVDKNRIGCVGFSLGGKESLYLAAFDGRVSACVANELGVGLKFSNWDAPWYLGKNICKRRDLENHEVIALIAPRPFLLVRGEGVDGKKSLPFVRAVKPIYALFGKTKALATMHHGYGHVCVPSVNARIYRWLDAWLKKDTDEDSDIVVSRGCWRDKEDRYNGVK